MKKLKILLLFVVMSISRGTGAQTNDKQFDITQLVEDAPEFSQDMPADREIPWYVRAIKTPASHVLLFFCDLWDRMQTKTSQLARSLWRVVWIRKMGQAAQAVYNHVQVQVIQPITPHYANYAIHTHEHA